MSKSEAPTLTKTLRDGRIATVAVTVEDGAVVVTTRRDGKELHSGWTPPRHRPGLPEGHVAAVGPLALTQAEADTVQAAYDQAEASLPRDLHAERRALVGAVLTAEDVWSDTRAYEHDHSDGSGRQFRHDAANEQRIKDAQGALCTFDAEHPEIKAEVDAKRAQDVERWADQ